VKCMREKGALAVGVGRQKEKSGEQMKRRSAQRRKITIEDRLSRLGGRGMERKRLHEK